MRILLWVPKFCHIFFWKDYAHRWKGGENMGVDRIFSIMLGLSQKKKSLHVWRRRSGATIPRSGNTKVNQKFFLSKQKDKNLSPTLTVSTCILEWERRLQGYVVVKTFSYLCKTF
jgi:hypothetical protein